MSADNVLQFVPKGDLLKLWVYPEEGDGGEWDCEMIWVRTLPGAGRRAQVKSVPWQSNRMAPEDEVIYDSEMSVDRVVRSGGYSVIRADFIGMGISDADADRVRSKIMLIGGVAFEFSRHLGLVVGVAFAVPGAQEVAAQALVDGDILVDCWRWGKRSQGVPA